MLTFKNISYSYPFQDNFAVENINFQVKAGEIVLCTGASGSGKSTLIRLANGLCPHYFKGQISGEVFVNSISTQDQSLAELASTSGTLFQDPEQQFFALNVEDELIFALECQGLAACEIKKRLEQATKSFDLNTLLNSSIHTLSEGQKQKAGLGSLWVQQPKLLILDEPSANLDPESALALADKLIELKNQGIAIFIVDHRLYWLKNAADKVIVMAQGKIAAQGNFELLHDPQFRQQYGLRNINIEDKRQNLPNCNQAPNPIVSVADLSFAYKDKNDLYQGHSFGLPSGITAIIGNNGTGKTTLARLLSGLSQASKGHFILNKQLANQKQRLKATALVLQNADHQLHMHTVLKELETCLHLAGHNIAEAQDLLQLFGLNQLATRHPQSLSGGEKQRLVIACALAKKPKILILDEPTSGLDGANMEKIASMLENCAKQGMCVLVITHDLELLECSCSQALRLPLI